MELASGTFGLVVGAGIANAEHKRSESKECQMRNYEAVTKIAEQSLNQDWRRKVKIFGSKVNFKDELIEILYRFESI